MSRGAALAIMLAVLAAIAVSAVALGSSHQSENEYAVTYELDGGDLVGDAPGSYKPGKYVGLPSAAKDGMFFQGWFEDPDLTVPIGAILPSREGNLKLYASWGEPLTGKRAAMDVSGYSDDRTVSLTGTVTYDFLAFSEGRYYINKTVSLLTSARFQAPVSTEDAESYWADKAYDEGCVYAGNKTFVGDYFSEGSGRYVCEAWEFDGGVVYVYHSIYILKQETRSSGAYSERNMVSFTSQEFDTALSLDVIAWPGTEVDVSGEVVIGGTVVLAAKGDAFAGWRIDGEKAGTDRTLTIEDAAPGRVYEALSSASVTVADGFVIQDAGLTLPVEVSDASGMKRIVSDGSSGPGGPGLYTIIDSGIPVKRAMQVLVCGSKDVRLNVSDGGQTYPVVVAMRSQDAFSYRVGGPTDDVQGLFTVDDGSVRDVASSLSSFKTGKTDREFAAFVLEFVQGIGSGRVASSGDGGQGWKYPSETLWYGSGDSADLSVLYATLMKALGYRSAVIEYDGSAAAAVLVDAVSGDSTKKIGKSTFVLADPGAPLGKSSDPSRRELGVHEVSKTPKEPIEVPDTDYSITYVLNGGVLADDAPEGYAAGVYTELPYAFNGEKYFEGWFTDESLTVPIGAILPTQKGNLTLYASWRDSLVGTGFEMEVNGSASSFLFSKTYTGTMAWKYLAYGDGAYYIQRDTDIVIRSPSLIDWWFNNDGGRIADTDYYWSDETDGAEYTYRGNEVIEGSYFGPRASYTCEIWASEDDTQYIYRGVYPLRMESVESGIKFTYTLSKVLEFEPVTDVKLKVYAEHGIEVEELPKVSIGDPFDLVASGEDFYGWYVDGLFFTSDEVMHEVRATPDRVYEARTASKYVLFDEDSLYFDDYGLVSPVTITEESGKTYTYSTGIRFNGNTTGCFTLVDSREPVPCVMRVFKDRLSQFSVSWEHEDVEYTMSFGMRYSDLYDYSNDGKDRAAFSSYEDVEQYFTVDDPYVEKACTELLAHKEASRMGDREFASFVMRFVQEIPYRYDEESRNALEFWKYPAETFWDKGGDCEDSSILYCTLMKRMGYDTALLVFRDHAMASIHFQDDSLNYGDNVAVKDGKRYVFVETTTDGITDKDRDGYQLGDVFSSSYSPRSVRSIFVLERSAHLQVAGDAVYVPGDRRPDPGAGDASGLYLGPSGIRDDRGVEADALGLRDHAHELLQGIHLEDHLGLPGVVPLVERLPVLLLGVEGAFDGGMGDLGGQLALAHLQVLPDDHDELVFVRSESGGAHGRAHGGHVNGLCG